MSRYVAIIVLLFVVTACDESLNQAGKLDTIANSDTIGSSDGQQPDLGTADLKSPDVAADLDSSQGTEDQSKTDQPDQGAEDLEHDQPAPDLQQDDLLDQAPAPDLTDTNAPDLSDTEDLGQADADSDPDLDTASPDLGVDLGLDTTDSADVAPVVFCSGTTKYLYDPLGSKTLNTFPDDFYTTEDSATLTGLRVVVNQSNAPFITEIPNNLLPAYNAMNTLDGWGTTAGIVLRFNAKLGDVPSGEVESLASDALMLVELTANGVKRIPFEVNLVDDGETIIMLPMVPLKPKTRHGVLVTNKLLDDAGNCIEPSAVLKQLLEGTSTTPGFQRLHPRYAELLQKGLVSADKVSAAVVFTTQSIVEQSVTIAADIKKRSYSWDTKPSCVDKTKYLECEGKFVAHNYRKDGVVVDGTSQSTYIIPVSIWLPATGKGPWPTIIYGHGIGGNRFQAAEFLSELATSMGAAVVAIDAVAHGDHPLGSGGSYLFDVAKFFAVDINTLTFRPLVQRDNWRQSTYDKLQMIRTLLADNDIDGDNSPDLDLDKLGYVGGSLGSIMSNELLALSDQFKWAIITVGGGRVVSIISDASAFNAVVDLVKPPSWTRSDIDRAFPIAQTLVDGGDSANYAVHIMNNRLPGAGTTPPHILVVMALDDTTVPNSATLMQVRSLNVPLFKPFFLDPELVPEQDLPQSLNWLSGKTTAGFYQYNMVHLTPDGGLKKAGHVSVNKSVEFLCQARHFIESWLKNGKPEVIDPFQSACGIN